MKMRAPLHSENQLLIGRVRSINENDRGGGGDIVLMRETRDGVERLKIFQRIRQDRFTKFFCRLYDSLRGNVNCTDLIEKRVASAKDATGCLNNNPQLKLQNALSNVRKDVEVAADICQRSEGLHNELIDLGVLSDDSFQYAELSEPNWDANTLREELQSNFSSLLTETEIQEGTFDSWDWLAQCRDTKDRVFTFREMTRAQELLTDLTKKAAHATPPQARALREVGRLVATMERQSIGEHDAIPANKLYQHLLRGANYLTSTKFNNEFAPLISSLNYPDRQLSLTNNPGLQNNLLLLHNHWQTLQDAPDLKIELMPLVFKVEQNYAQRIKIFGPDLALNDFSLTLKQVKFMADDIRRCIATEKAKPAEE